MKNATRFFSWYPLTGFGTAIALGALISLGTGLIRSDSLSAAAGLTALLFAIIPSVAVFFLKNSADINDLLWESSGDIHMLSEKRIHYIRLSRWTLPIFFRLHIRIDSKIHLQSRVLYKSRYYYRLEDSQPVYIRIFAPLPGSLSMHASVFIGDAFGISRRKIGRLDRQTHVLPRLSEPANIHHMESSNSDDDNNMVKKSDQEKIFIREYQNGDLARDINWKASGKIDKLLTRIPPESESKTRLLKVMLLHSSAGRVGHAGYQSQLAAVKSQAVGFIAAVHRLYSNYVIDVYLNEKLIALRDEQDFKAVYRSIAAWLPPVSIETGLLPDIRSTLTLFSGSFCAELPSYVAHLQNPDIRLSLVEGSDRRREQEGDEMLVQMYPTRSRRGDFIPYMKPLSMNAPKARLKQHSASTMTRLKQRCVLL